MMVESRGKSIAEKQNDLVESFSLFEDWTDKYEVIIGMGKDLEVLDEQYKIDENLIKGCQSKVWLHAEMADGKLYFQADSDAIITKGLVSMFVNLFSGQPPQDILDADLSFIDKIGLKEHLSPTRSNGLLSMVKQMKFYALAFSTKA